MSAIHNTQFNSKQKILNCQVDGSLPLSIDNKRHSAGPVACHNRVERTPGMVFSVYVIECKLTGYYVGTTRNLLRRLEQHRTLKGSSRFVREHGGLSQLVCSESLATKAEAKKRESELTKALIRKHGAAMVAGAGLINLLDRERYERRCG